MKKNLLLLSVLLFSITNFAQSFPGLSYDNYSGIHGVLHNPANVVGSPYKFDFNLFSINALANNDYAAFDLKAILKGNGKTSDKNYFDPSSEHTTATLSNNANLDIDYLGTSVMFNLSKNSSVAINSRLRSFLTVSDIDGSLIKYFIDGFEDTEDYQITVDNAAITIHQWLEIGLTYGHKLKLNSNTLLKLGARVKYLKGFNLVHASLNNFTADYTAASKTLNTRGQISVGTSSDYESDSYKPAKGSNGFGFDVGAVFQWADKSVKERKRTHNFDRYRVRVGVSITDIGKLSYPEAELNNYDANRNDIDIIEIENGNGFVNTIESIYPGQGFVENLKTKLPTAAHINLDFSINNSFYVNLNTDLSLSKTLENGNRIISNYAVTPRYESKWLSIYSPMNYDEFKNIGWGFGFRLGPLMVGSGNVLSTLMQPTTKKADVYVGLRFSSFKKSISPEEIEAKSVAKETKKTVKQKAKEAKKKEKEQRKLKKKQVKAAKKGKANGKNVEKLTEKKTTKEEEKSRKTEEKQAKRLAKIKVKKQKKLDKEKAKTEKKSNKEN